MLISLNVHDPVVSSTDNGLTTGLLNYMGDCRPREESSWTLPREITTGEETVLPFTFREGVISLNLRFHDTHSFEDHSMLMSKKHERFFVLFFRALLAGTMLAGTMLAGTTLVGSPRSVAKSAGPSGRLAATLQPLIDEHALAGAVTLVADRERILSLDAVGFSDIAADRPMASDALFWIASQSKPMTATALMMLVDDGKVRLDDPVEKYLPEFKGQWLVREQDDRHMLLVPPEHPITVRNLLSHTSGLPFKSAMEGPTLDLLPLRDAVRSHAMTPLQFEPDEKYRYSNAGLNTAGRIIELVSQMPYETFLQERIFVPLGMTDTTFWPSTRQLTRLAKSYKPNVEKTGLQETLITQLRYPLDDHARYPIPAGGLFSTAADVCRFCQMILAGGQFQGRRYLSAAAVQQMTSRQTGPNIKTAYGLGWRIEGNAFGHRGAYATAMQILPEQGLVLVYMVQHAGFPKNGKQGYAIFRKTALELFGSLSNKKVHPQTIP